MPLLLFNKPCRVMCQFSASDGRQTLANYLRMPAVYPAGRLDFESEGLLLLTDDGQLQARISDPRHKLDKHYRVQVEGIASTTALQQLLAGVDLKDGAARAIEAESVREPPDLWARVPPIRVRKSIPTSWLSISINEGRNRQVRRMTAAVGLPTLRLVRERIGPWSLDHLQPGEYRSLPTETAWQQLKSYHLRGAD